MKAYIVEKALLTDNIEKLMRQFTVRVTVKIATQVLW